MVKSVLTYGAETWSLYEDDRRKINPLSTKLYLPNLKTHFVPRSKHSLLRF